MYLKLFNRLLEEIGKFSSLLCYSDTDNVYWRENSEIIAIVTSVLAFERSTFIGHMWHFFMFLEWDFITQMFKYKIAKMFSFPQFSQMFFIFKVNIKDTSSQVLISVLSNQACQFQCTCLSMSDHGFLPSYFPTYSYCHMLQ